MNLLKLSLRTLHYRSKDKERKLLIKLQINNWLRIGTDNRRNNTLSDENVIYDKNVSEAIICCSKWKDLLEQIINAELKDIQKSMDINRFRVVVKSVFLTSFELNHKQEHGVRWYSSIGPPKYHKTKWQIYPWNRRRDIRYVIFCMKKIGKNSNKVKLL